MIFQGDIVIANFPFSDEAEFKIRPAIVVSNPSVNNSGDYILVGISSATNNFHAVPITFADIASGSFNRSSFIHCDKIQRINKRFIKASVGSITNELLHKIIQKIHDYLKIEEKKI